MELEKGSITSTTDNDANELNWISVIPHQELERYIAGTSQRSEISGKLA